AKECYNEAFQRSPNFRQSFAVTVKQAIQILEARGLLAEACDLFRNSPAEETACEVVLQKKMAREEYDVFLAYSSADRAVVQAIAGKLRQRGIYPWLDVEQISPGRSWQGELAMGLAKATIQSIVVFIGMGRVNQWMRLELQSIISQYIDTGKR